MFTRFCAAVSRLSLMLAVVGLIAVILCVQWQVVGRYIFNDTPTWAENLALLLVLFVTAFGLAVGVRDAGHIGLESLVMLLPEKWQRRIELLAGEIFIATGKDAARRPFFVDTPHGSLQALGTRFTVRLHDGYASAGVLEGVVAALADDGSQRLVLHPGESAHFDSAGLHRQALAPYGGAWLNGMLVARDMRLDEFLAELSRYSKHPLACTPAIAGLRVSGSYPLADVDAILDAVSASLQLRRNTVTRFWGRQVVRIELARR